jgi:ArsR family transcriptional regulator
MPQEHDDEVAKFADMLAAMGAEPRLRVVRLLLIAHPKGLAAGDISAELAITPSTLSHHLDRLKRENVVTVRREGTFLWYTVNTAAIEKLLKFLFAECCTRSSAISPERITFHGPDPAVAEASAGKPKH